VAAYFVDVKDVAALHIAAILDPNTRDARLQVWGRASNWNEFLAVLRSLRPDKDFMQDYSETSVPTISTDQKQSVELLRKWTGQDDWRAVKEFVADSIETHYFKFS
jgi:hypothetical protein